MELQATGDLPLLEPTISNFNSIPCQMSNLVKRLVFWPSAQAIPAKISPKKFQPILFRSPEIIEVKIRNRQTERQTDRQTDRQTNSLTPYKVVCGFFQVKFTTSLLAWLAGG